MLHGVAQASLDRSGEPWQDLEGRYRQDSLAAVRAHLGDEQFDRAYAKGMTLSTHEGLQLTFRDEAEARHSAIVESSAGALASGETEEVRRAARRGRPT